MSVCTSLDAKFGLSVGMQAQWTKTGDSNMASCHDFKCKENRICRRQFKVIKKHILSLND